MRGRMLAAGWASESLPCVTQSQADVAWGRWAATLAIYMRRRLRLQHERPVPSREEAQMCPSRLPRAGTLTVPVRCRGN